MKAVLEAVTPMLHLALLNFGNNSMPYFCNYFLPLCSDTGKVSEIITRFSLSLQPQKDPLKDFPKPWKMQKEELITVQPTDLSAWKFVVYQYGLSTLQLLIPQLHVKYGFWPLYEVVILEPRRSGDQEGSFEVVAFTLDNGPRAGNFIVSPSRGLTGVILPV